MKKPQLEVNISTVLSLDMISKIADAGISYQHMNNVFGRGGDSGLRSFLGKTVNGKLRVTKNRRVIDSLVAHFTQSARQAMPKSSGADAQ